MAGFIFKEDARFKIVDLQFVFITSLAEEFYFDFEVLNHYKDHEEVVSKAKTFFFGLDIMVF